MAIHLHVLFALFWRLYLYNYRYRLCVPGYIATYFQQESINRVVLRLKR